MYIYSYKDRGHGPHNTNRITQTQNTSLAARQNIPYSRSYHTILVVRSFPSRTVTHGPSVLLITLIMIINRLIL